MINRDTRGQMKKDMPQPKQNKGTGLSPLFAWVNKKQKQQGMVNKANTLFPNMQTVDSFNRLYRHTLDSSQNTQPSNPMPRQASMMSNMKNIDMIIKAYNNGQ